MLIENTDPLLEDLDYSGRSPGQQAQINALIEVCSELIEKKCNRIFLQADYTDEKQDGTNENYIYVNNPPINSLSTITVSGSEDTDFDGALFTYNDKTGEIRWNDNYLVQGGTSDWLGTFPRGYRNHAIDYNGGFLDIPAPIKFACADLVFQGFSPESGFGNIDAEKLGQYFYRLRKDAIDRALLTHRNILNLYTIKRVNMVSNLAD